jgi:serine/threonine protein kinase
LTETVFEYIGINGYHVVPIEDDYVIGKELGRGRFSVVCECVNKVTGEHAAVKIIDKATIEPEVYIYIYI